MCVIDSSKEKSSFLYFALPGRGLLIFELQLGPNINSTFHFYFVSKKKKKKKKKKQSCLHDSGSSVPTDWPSIHDHSTHTVFLWLGIANVNRQLRVKRKSVSTVFLRRSTTIYKLRDKKSTSADANPRLVVTHQSQLAPDDDERVNEPRHEPGGGQGEKRRKAEIPSEKKAERDKEREGKTRERRSYIVNRERVALTITIIYARETLTSLSYRGGNYCCFQRN